MIFQKNVIIITLLSILALALSGNACSQVRSKQQKQEVIKEKLKVKEGIVSTKAQTIRFRNKGLTVAKVKISKPILVAMASQPEKWGYFQFPVMDRAADGTILVGWQMNEDSHLAYGKSAGRKGNIMMSKDEGCTWQELDKGYFVRLTYYKAKLKDGRMLEIITPPSKDIRKYKKFPKAVGHLANNYNFFRMEDLPDDLQGNYLALWDKNGNAKYIHGKIHDTDLLRPAISYSLPVVWWGIPRQLADGSVEIGASQMYYKGLLKVQPSSVTFYRTTDLGKTWNILGMIPYEPYSYLHPEGSKREFDGFTEPYWVILKDSTFLCVMRSEDQAYAPLYKTYSKDKGHTWSKPEPFTSNGVLPKMLMLNNNVLVLASGRPGVQIRFSLDGTGNSWTEPIDMMHFTKKDGTHDLYASCGYTSLLPIDDDTFLIVYSDFHEKNSTGEERKAIKVRRVTIKRS